MKKRGLWLLIFILVLMLGCTPVVRYSPEEIKHFPPEIQERIKKNEVATGMTQLQVRYSWGPPESVNVLSPSSDGKYREEWVYTRSMGLFKTQLIFTEGQLTEIITTEPGVIRK